MIPELIKHIPQLEQLNPTFITNQYFYKILISELQNPMSEIFVCDENKFYITKPSEEMKGINQIEFQIDDSENLMKLEKSSKYMPTTDKSYEAFGVNSNFNYIQTIYDMYGTELQKNSYSLEAKEPYEDISLISKEKITSDIDLRYPNFETSTMMLNENLIGLSFPKTSYTLASREKEVPVTIHIREKKKQQKENEYFSFVDINNPKFISFDKIEDHKIENDDFLERDIEILENSIKENPFLTDMEKDNFIRSSNNRRK